MGREGEIGEIEGNEMVEEEVRREETK